MSPDRAALPRLLTTRLSRAAVISNVVGATDVFVFLAFLTPLSVPEEVWPAGR